MRCSIIPTATRTAQPFPGIIGVSRVLSHMYLCSQRRLGSSLSSSYRSAARHRTSHAASSADRTLARRLSNITCGTAVRDFPFVAHSPASARILGDEYAVVFPDMITEEEEMVLMSDLEAVFKRKRYEKGHWDSVIEDYKESERLDGGWSPRSQGIVDAVRKMPWLKSFGEAAPWLPVHAIDLAPTGFIRPHVDSVKFSGGVVAGLSLLSSAVMRLTRSTDEDAVADLLLLPRSLYVLRGPARFEWAHAILPSDGGPISWHGRSFPRGRRVSLIFRDELGGSPPEPHPGTIGEGMATSTSTGGH